MLHTPARRPGALERPVSARQLARAVRQQMDVELSPALLEVQAGLARTGVYLVSTGILKAEGQRVQLALSIERVLTRTPRQQTPPQAS